MREVYGWQTKWSFAGMGRPRHDRFMPCVPSLLQTELVAGRRREPATPPATRRVVRLDARPRRGPLPRV